MLRRIFRKARELAFESQLSIDDDIRHNKINYKE